MKTILTYILIGATLGIAMLGFLVMDHHVGFAGSGECVAETVNGAICPNNPIGSALFHLDAIRFFSTATFNSSAFIGLSFLLALVAVFYKKRRSNLALLQFSFKSIISAPPAPSEIRFRDWLAFHELSPPFGSAAR